MEGLGAGGRPYPAATANREWLICAGGSRVAPMGRRTRPTHPPTDAQGAVLRTLLEPKSRGNALNPDSAPPLPSTMSTTPRSPITVPSWTPPDAWAPAPVAACRPACRHHGLSRSNRGGIPSRVHPARKAVQGGSLPIAHPI
jgi:hypothetical protein